MLHFNYTFFNYYLKFRQLFLFSLLILSMFYTGTFSIYFLTWFNLLHYHIRLRFWKLATFCNDLWSGQKQSTAIEFDSSGLTIPMIPLRFIVNVHLRFTKGFSDVVGGNAIIDFFFGMQRNTWVITSLLFHGFFLLLKMIKKNIFL